MCCVMHVAPAPANRSMRCSPCCLLRRCRTPCGIHRCLPGSAWAGSLLDHKPSDFKRKRIGSFKGGIMNRLSFRMFALLASLALLMAACASNTSPSTTGAAVTPHPTQSSMMMNLPAYAKDYKVSITSPTSGTKVTANTVTVTVATTGYTPTCALAGNADQAGTGHYHILLDKSLVNMYCAPTTTISLQNMSAGIHTLT